MKSDFYPRPVLAFGYCQRLRLCVCVSVCVCVSQSLACPRDNSGPVQARIAKFGLKVYNTLVKIPIVFGVIGHDLQGQIKLPSQNLPHFELVRAITHHPFGLGPLNLDQRCKIPWLRSLLFWGLIELDMSNLTYFQNPDHLHRFCVFEILVRPA